MKELFEDANLAIICFDAEDIIKTSNNLPDDILPFALWLEDEDDILSFISNNK